MVGPGIPVGVNRLISGAMGVCGSSKSALVSGKYTSSLGGTGCAMTTSGFYGRIDIVLRSDGENRW